MPKMKVLQLPETKYAIATEHRIPEDGFSHKLFECPCDPDYQRQGNKVIVLHIEVADKRC